MNAGHQTEEKRGEGFAFFAWARRREPLIHYEGWLSNLKWRWVTGGLR